MQDIVYWNVPDGYAYDDGSGDWNENKCRGGLWHHDLTPKKSALRLHTLINEVWHTDLEAVTDESGYIEFRGFYGGYTASGQGFHRRIRYTQGRLCGKRNNTLSGFAMSHWAEQQR